MRLLVAVFLVIALSGCGDKGSDASFDTPDKEDGAYIITVGSTIDPSKAKVPGGAIVEWRIETNGCYLKSDDGTIDSSKRPTTDGTTYNNGNLPKGKAWRWEAVEGEYDYGCSGKGIRGTIKVS